MAASDSWRLVLHWLLKPKFYTKWLEIIHKKRKAVQKFMKSDVAELLRRGHDHDYNNAYRKCGELLMEQNMLSCYELIAKYIGCISDHLDDLSKQKDCPDECKEAVPSLMYAASRIGDLPELRDMRTLFTEKFGNSLEPYISKELVEKLRRDPPAREMKIRLLHDIAQEFSLEWDGKDFEQPLYSQPSLHGERSNKLDKTDNLASLAKHTDGRDYIKSKGKERDTLSQGSNDLSVETWNHQSSSEDEASTDMSSEVGRKSSSISLGSTSEDDEVENKRPSSYWIVPPPYLKQKANKGKEKADPSQQPEYDKGQNRKGGRRISHVRGASLPTEPTNAMETLKGHARTMSLDQVTQKRGEGHVHPNLPLDYDDLLARLAALRGR